MIENCYYTGHVEGLAGSYARLSTCFGLHGIITINQTDYVIEPTSTSVHENAHVVYSAALPLPAEPEDHCGVKEPQRSLDSGNAHGNNRQRRALPDMHIELLVVTDTELMTRYGDQLEAYVLTMVHMANFRFERSGHSIRLAVSRLIHFTEPNVNLSIVTDAGELLSNTRVFHEAVLNGYTGTDLTEPQFHDATVLLTATDICLSSCATLGLAPVGGMCDESASAVIVEDVPVRWFHGANIISHEIGHLLGKPDHSRLKS